MKMLRHWGGIVDICPDASPIITKTHINGLYLIVVGVQVVLKLQVQVGCLHTIANDEAHSLNALLALTDFQVVS